ncbi:hypothetical protein HMPREF9148_02449 [Prevotella sp. F0091]|nr:hypothetical protein HMPREF9148_02449 [Prevotella sp. F0091]
MGNWKVFCTFVHRMIGYPFHLIYIKREKKDEEKLPYVVM